MEAYNDMFHNPAKMSVRSTVSEEEAAQFDYKEPFKAFFLEVFRQGYKKAEKELALSIDDIEKIHTFLYAIKNNKHGAFTFTRLSDEQYKEVLRRFKAIKEEQK